MSNAVPMTARPGAAGVAAPVGANGPDGAANGADAGGAAAETAAAAAALEYAGEEVPAPPASGDGASLRGRAVRGSLWTLGGHVAGQFLRFGGNLVLAWLLNPKLFGVMALVNIFVQGLGMFSDVGIGPAIIQNKRGDQPAFLNTAWTIQVVRGFVLWLAACLIAWPIARLYGIPELFWLIPVSALTAVLQGFNSTKLFTLNRHLELGRITLVEIAARAVSLGVMVAWAWSTRHNPTVWPLVAGSITSVAVTLLLSHAALPGVPNRLYWDPSAARELFRFGRWIFVSTVLTFLATQADRLIFGKMIPLEVLGVYSIAALMAAMPTAAILKVGSSVMFAAYSRAREAHDSFAPFFERARLPLLAVGGVAVTCMIAVGPAAVDLLYDRRYLGAGWILQLLAVAAWLQILQVTGGSALLALGATRWVAAGNVAKLSGMVLLIPLGYRIYGLPGAIGGIIASDLLKYAVSAFAVRRQGLRVGSIDLLLSLLVAAAAALGAGAAWVAAREVPGGGAAAALAAVGAGVFVGCGAWVPVGWRLLPALRRKG